LNAQSVHLVFTAAEYARSRTVQAGIWWVVSPAGKKITKTADTGGGGGY
jgi:hypothetical protein